MWSIRGRLYPENRNQIKFWGLKTRKITDCYVVCNGLQGGICSFVVINEFTCGYNVINSESLQLVGYRFPESLSLIMDTFLTPCDTVWIILCIFLGMMMMMITPYFCGNIFLSLLHLLTWFWHLCFLFQISPHEAHHGVTLFWTEWNVVFARYSICYAFIQNM